ncbi:DNA-binding transcriptional regulator YiaG [Nitrobacteraceae bacterium AZCC 2146]
MKVVTSTQIVGLDENSWRRYFGRMTPQQCRAARAWLDWSQDDLASAAHVSLSTVRDYEKERRVPIANNLGAMRAALESNGVGFVFDDQGGASGITFAKP